MGAHIATRHMAAGATIIDSPEQSEALADHLLDPARLRPVIVVTTAAGQGQPYIDVNEIIDVVHGLADVYVLPTGRVTFALSDRLPEKTQVYGGAGRVYPVSCHWQTDPYAAPLRFAFGEAQGPSATGNLIADALGAAHAAGLDTSRIGATVVHVEGTVRALFAPSRAWVRTDDGRDAAIWLDLLRPGLRLDRVFEVGMRICGALDVEECRIDVARSLIATEVAMADYAVGAVVLVRVVELDNIAAVVELYPGVRTEMSANEVTGNPMDRLTTVMTVDEVLPVRVVARGRQDGRGWRLSTLDVEDFEEILASPGLLPGGPAWLVPGQSVLETSAAGPVSATASSATSRSDRTDRIDETDQLDETEDGVSESPPLDTKEVRHLCLGALDDREALRRQIAKLEARLLRSTMTEHAFQVERDGFRDQVGRSYVRVLELERSAEKARTDLRLEKQKSQRLEKQVRSARAGGNQHSSSNVLFTDPAAQFLYEVNDAYAHRIPAGDKAARRRREVFLGSDFLATLTSVEGVDRSKVVAVTVEILTDLVNELDGRELHPLREGYGGGERDVVRSDGGRCMRVALQRTSSSARCLHYWKVGDAIELSRVVKHDDMTP